MRIYIAGPMSGLPEHNFPEFQRVADTLRGLGREVISPHELEGKDVKIYEVKSKILEKIKPLLKFIPWQGRDAVLSFLEDKFASENVRWLLCMKRDLKSLSSCDTIALLRGWENSKGATTELFV